MAEDSKWALVSACAPWVTVNNPLPWNCAHFGQDDGVRKVSHPLFPWITGDIALAAGWSLFFGSLFRDFADNSHSCPFILPFRRMQRLAPQFANLNFLFFPASLLDPRVWAGLLYQQCPPLFCLQAGGWSDCYQWAPAKMLNPPRSPSELWVAYLRIFTPQVIPVIFNSAENNLLP